MLDDRLCKVVGNPNEKVTHWGISRVKLGGKLERLDHPAEGGVRVREWPLAELALDEVRARWGAGSYKIHWLIPDADDPQQRSGGHGPLFTLDPELSTHVAPPPPAPTMPAAAPVAIAAPSNGLTADSLLTVVTTMMQLSDKRAEATINAITALASAQRAPERSAGPDVAVLNEMAALRAELAATNARTEAAAQRAELEAKHREEVARLQREVEDAKRRADEAEREAERETKPAIEPGQPIMTQLGFGAANALMQKPEIAAALIEKAAPVLGALFGVGAPAASPPPPASGPAPSNGVPAPKVMPAAPPVVRAAAPVVKPAAPIDPATSSWQPIAPPPPSTEQPVAEQPAPAAEAAG